MVENVQELSGAMGVDVPTQANMTLKNFKDMFLFVQMQIDNLEHNLVNNTYTSSYVKGQLKGNYAKLDPSQLITPLQNTMKVATVLIGVMNCDGVMERFKRMGQMLRTDVIDTAQGKSGVQAALCVMFFICALCGIVTKYVLDRPHKTYYAKETGRWFKYEVCLRAHDKVRAKYEADHAHLNLGKRVIHTLLHRGTYWHPPPYSVSTVIADITLTYISSLMILALQSVLVVLAVDQAKTDITFGCWCCVTATALGLYGSWDDLTRKDNKYALVLSGIFVVTSMGMFIYRLVLSAHEALDCKTAYDDPSLQNCSFTELGEH